MKPKQKSIVINLVFIVVVTALFVAAMYVVKDFVNKSEAIRAMKLVSADIQKYRSRYGSLPSESYVIRQMEELRIVRLGNLQYRAQWISFDSGPDTILAYAARDFQLLVKSGYVVLRLDGRVEWIPKRRFEDLLSTQQSQSEIELLQKNQTF